MIQANASDNRYPTLGEIWDFAMEQGVAVGHRDPASVWRACDRNRARYEKLAPEKKRFFDKARLTIPFGDCRIYTGKRADRIRGLLAAIDGTPEMALRIHELNSKGWNIDLLFAHHGGPREMMYTAEDFCVPTARTLARIYGIAVEALMPIETEARKMARQPGCGGGGPRLYMNVMGAAEMCRQIGVAHITLHTPCDVFAVRAVWDVLNAAAPTTCQEAIKAAYRIPEFRRLRQQRQQPIRMFAGQPKNKLGRWWNANCAATVTLNEKSIRALKNAGFESIVGVIYEGKLTEAAKKYGLNVVHLPHDASDTLGINGLLDCLVDRWPALEILAHGNFFRVERPRPGAWTEAAI